MNKTYKLSKVKCECGSHKFFVLEDNLPRKLVCAKCQAIVIHHVCNEGMYHVENKTYSKKEHYHNCLSGASCEYKCCCSMRRYTEYGIVIKMVVVVEIVIAIIVMGFYLNY